MCHALSLYFADLLAGNATLISSSEEEDNSSQTKPQHQIQIQQIIFDNAKLPSPLFGGSDDMDGTMGHGSDVLGSCHTRSTVSTCTSNLSSSSHQSIASTGSTGSASCRWDSNPSAKKDKAVGEVAVNKRPRLPARNTSDNLKVVRVSKSSSISDKAVANDKMLAPPSRNNSNRESSSSSSDAPSKPKSSRLDKPTRPTRTTSNNAKQSKAQKQQQQQQSPPRSLDKMLVVPINTNTKMSSKVASGSADSESSSSETSLKEIFRTASQTRRGLTGGTTNAGGSGGIGGAFTAPVPGARNSPSRTVNEILGQSMDELQISW